MQITRHTVAAIDYTLTDASGEVIDSSEGQEPLTYLHGEGNLIPGLEEALEGASPGDTLQVSVPPHKAYGDHDADLVQPIPMAAFDGVGDVAAGMRFQVADDQGQPRTFTVASVEGDRVMIDANHPLAGQTLNFSVNIVSVRNATPEEIDHGHVHDGHAH